MRNRGFLLAAVAFTSMAACQAPVDQMETKAAGETMTAVDVTAEAGAIEDVNAQWLAAVTRGDAAGAASFYTADGRLMMPNAPTAQGMAAIEEAFTMILGLPNVALAWAQENVEVAAGGGLAYDVGTYTLGYDGPDGRVDDNGKYVVVWKKTDAGWRVAADIFNSNLPAQ